MVQALVAGKNGTRTATKNVSFTRELLVASGGGNDVHRASQGWALAHFGVNHGRAELHCQLCHAYIVNFAVITHAKNAMQLMIGHDCLEKLANLQRTGRVESISATLPTWKSYRSGVRAFIKTELKGKRDIVASVTKWLASQKDLPESVRETLEWLEKFGAPQSEEKARELVAYYKAHRKFPVEELINGPQVWSYRFHPRKRMLPKEVTLQKLPQLLRVLERGVAITKRRYEAERVEEARLRMEFEVKAVAERRTVFKGRIEELVRAGAIFRAALLPGKNPRTHAPEWKLVHKGKLCVLSYNETYDAAEGAVLLVPHEIPEKKITILFRAYPLEERGYPMLAYRDQTGAKRTLH